MGVLRFPDRQDLIYGGTDLSGGYLAPNTVDKARKYLSFFIENIASDLNDSTSVYFIRQFRQRCGAAPDQYRKKVLRYPL